MDWKLQTVYLKTWWLSLLEKWPYSECFWSVFSRIRTEYEEVWTRKTPNMNTFHAVLLLVLNQNVSISIRNSYKVQRSFHHCNIQSHYIIWFDCCARSCCFVAYLPGRNMVKRHLFWQIGDDDRMQVTPDLGDWFNITACIWCNAGDWKLVPGPLYDFNEMTV